MTRGNKNICVSALLWKHTHILKTGTNKMAFLQEVERGPGGNDWGMGNKIHGLKRRDFFDYTFG